MSQPLPNVAVILLAGGKGNRMEQATDDKALMQIAGMAVIRHSIEAFQKTNQISQFIIVHRDPQQKAEIEKLTADISPHWTLGGAERQNSVLAGLKAANNSTDIVLIHDCARPLITPKTISATISAAQSTGAACVARKVTDTIKQTNTTHQLTTLDRTHLWAMETPQAFEYKLILDAYRQHIANGKQATDDTAILEATGHPITLIENTRPNPKLTTPKDIPLLEFLLKS